MIPERTAPFRQLLGLLPEVDALEVLRIALARHATDRVDQLWSDGAQAATVDVRVLDSQAVRAAVAEALAEQRNDTDEIYAAIGDALVAEIEGDRAAASFRLIKGGEAREEKGRFAAALRFYRTALESAGPLGDRAPQILALRRIGRVQIMRGEAVEAEECYRRSMELARDTGSLQDEIIARTGLGNLALRLGQWARGEAFYREALERTQADPEQLAVERGHLLTNVAWAMAKQENFADAELWLERAAEAWRLVTAPDWTTWHSVRAHILWERGDIEAARQEYTLALEAGAPAVRRASFEIDLANLLLEAGDIEGARHWGRVAESSALAASAVGYVSEVYRGLGNIARVAGEEAVPFYEKSLEIARRYGLRLAEAETLVEYARLQRATGNEEEGLALVEHAVGLFDSLGATEDARRAREDLARGTPIDEPDPLPPA